VPKVPVPIRRYVEAGIEHDSMANMDNAMYRQHASAFGHWTVPVSHQRPAEPVQFFRVFGDDRDANSGGCSGGCSSMNCVPARAIHCGSELLFNPMSVRELRNILHLCAVACGPAVF
jgi:hypothetical protein